MKNIKNDNNLYAEESDFIYKIKFIFILFIHTTENIKNDNLYAKESNLIYKIIFIFILFIHVTEFTYFYFKNKKYITCIISVFYAKC